MYANYKRVNDKFNMALNIKKAIQSRGLEVASVAEKLGITPFTLSRQINGNPTVKKLSEIAAVLGCNVTEFFDDESSKQELTCPHCGNEIHINLSK